MPTICFIRTTYENGQFRPFAPKAHPFWRERSVIVGEVLRPECDLTFAEVAAAYQRHIPQQISLVTLLQPDETWLAWGFGTWFEWVWW